MQGLQSGSALPNHDKLISTLECIFGLLEDGPTVVS